MRSRNLDPKFHVGGSRSGSRLEHSHHQLILSETSPDPQWIQLPNQHWTTFHRRSTQYCLPLGAGWSDLYSLWVPLVAAKRTLILIPGDILLDARWTIRDVKSRTVGTWQFRANRTNCLLSNLIEIVSESPSADVRPGLVAALFQQGLRSPSCNDSQCCVVFVHGRQELLHERTMWRSCLRLHGSLDLRINLMSKRLDMPTFGLSSRPRPGLSAA